MDSYSSLPSVLTAQMMADFLHVSRSTIYNLMEAGQLPNKQIGLGHKASRRVMKIDFIKWLERKTAGGA